MATNRLNYNRFQEPELKNENNKTIYFCLDRLVDDINNPGKQKVIRSAEFGVGKLDEIKSIGKEYEQEYIKLYSDYNFVMLQFFDRVNKNYGFAKVYFKGDHEDINSEFLKYVNKLKCEIINYMRKQNPDCDLNTGRVSIHGSDDTAILSMVRKRVRAEEIVDYII